MNMSWFIFKKPQEQGSPVHLFKFDFLQICLEAINKQNSIGYLPLFLAELVDLIKLGEIYFVGLLIQWCRKFQNAF